MATIDDAILAAVQGAGTPAEKIKIINELRKALPTDRWTFRWVIWGLIVVVLVPAVGVFLIWLFRGNVEINSLPQGLISLASTALGALAAFITPGSHQLNPPAGGH
jgi:hypothetical protein